MAAEEGAAGNFLALFLDEHSKDRSNREGNVPGTQGRGTVCRDDKENVLVQLEHLKTSCRR